MASAKAGLSRRPGAVKYALNCCKAVSSLGVIAVELYLDVTFASQRAGICVTPVCAAVWLIHYDLVPLHGVLASHGRCS